MFAIVLPVRLSEATRKYSVMASRMVGCSGSVLDTLASKGLGVAGRAVGSTPSRVPSGICRVEGLFPLDGAGGLAGDVENDAVHFAHFVGDAGGNAREHFVRKARPISRHRIF